MAPSKPKHAPDAEGAATAGATGDVDAFMAALDHPDKPTIEALREIILGVHPTIAEGIKWKVPSFRTREYFATTHLRTKHGVGLILHLGAKVRETPGLAIEDPDGLLQWLGKDRAMVTFSGLADLQRRRTALERLLLQWIRFV